MFYRKIGRLSSTAVRVIFMVITDCFCRYKWWKYTMDIQKRINKYTIMTPENEDIEKEWYNMKMLIKQQ